MQDKKMVALPQQTIPHFESGFIIGQIVKIILKKSGQKIPSYLDDIKMDTNKNTKLSNWNFVW